MTSLSLLTEHPLSEDRLKNVFENTRHLNYLCSYLHIPDDKRNVAGAVESYPMSGDPMKGRKMIFGLDENGDTSLADSVMDCAEPPAGTYIMYICTHVHCTCIHQHIYMYMYVHVQLVLGVTVHDRPHNDYHTHMCRTSPCGTSSVTRGSLLMKIYEYKLY